MKLREEIQQRFQSLGPDGVRRILFKGLSLPSDTMSDAMSSLMAGHHIFLAGPPGVGKTTLANRIVELLTERTVVDGCPVNCSFESPACPWCLERLAKGEELSSSTMPGTNRVCKVSGSAELKVADLVGDFNPQMALEYGILDLRAFVPGKLLRANGGILLIDFMDSVRERVLNAILMGLAGDAITIGYRDEQFPLDVLVVATGSISGMVRMPMDLSDHFDRVPMGTVHDTAFESRLLCGSKDTVPWEKPAMMVIQQSRQHEDLSRGISTRGTIRYGELLNSYAGLIKEEAPEKLLPVGSGIALPHRVEVAPHAVSNRSANEIIQEIVDDVLDISGSSEELLSLSRGKMLAIVDEIAKVDHFRNPLKFGLFDLLLKRIKRFPES